MRPKGRYLMHFNLKLETSKFNYINHTEKIEESLYTGIRKRQNTISTKDESKESLIDTNREHGMESNLKNEQREFIHELCVKM